MRIVFFVVLFSAILIGLLYMLEPNGGGVATHKGVSPEEQKYLKHLPKL